MLFRSASLLNTRNISQLYEELTNGFIYPSGMSSLKASLKLSINALKKTSFNSLKLFKLLALFPSGATSVELNKIWGTDYFHHMSKLQENSLL